MVFPPWASSKRKFLASVGCGPGACQETGLKPPTKHVADRVLL